VARPSDLWVLGDRRPQCGDSTKPGDVRRLMKGERAVLFATDPPYLVDYDGSANGYAALLATAVIPAALSASRRRIAWGNCRADFTRGKSSSARSGPVSP
jgi:hypothetical protein